MYQRPLLGGDEPITARLWRALRLLGILRRALAADVASAPVIGMEDGTRRPGDTIDGYRIVRRLASGGHGDVYEAVHDFTGRGVALKCLKNTPAGPGDLAERMRLEAVVLARLRHPNLVTVFDAGVTPDGIVWIAMDLLVGATLRERLRAGGRMPVAEALRVACAIADGVAAAHAVRVIHRDLKPENVFVMETGEVKVLDLGTAKFVGYGLKPTESLQTLGTPAYMAPEQLLAAPVDARTDVYALGLTLYEMLAGRHAFARAGRASLPNGFELTQAQLFSIPTPIGQLIAGFPDEVDRLVARATAKGMDQRYSTLEDFAAEMRAILASPGYGGHGPRTGPSTSSPRRGPPPLGGVIARGIVVGALLGVATASFGVLVVVRGRAAPAPALPALIASQGAPQSAAAALPKPTSAEAATSPTASGSAPAVATSTAEPPPTPSVPPPPVVRAFPSPHAPSSRASSAPAQSAPRPAGPLMEPAFQP